MSKRIVVVVSLMAVGCIDEQRRVEIANSHQMIEQQYKDAADACIKAGGVPQYCQFCDMARMKECQWPKR